MPLTLFLTQSSPTVRERIVVMSAAAAAVSDVIFVGYKLLTSLSDLQLSLKSPHASSSFTADPSSSVVAAHPSPSPLMHQSALLLQV